MAKKLITVMLLMIFVLSIAAGVYAATVKKQPTIGLHQVKGVIDLSKPKSKTTTPTDPKTGLPVYNSNKGFKGVSTGPKGVMNLKKPATTVTDKKKAAALTNYRNKMATPGKYQYLVDAAKNSTKSGIYRKYK